MASSQRRPACWVCSPSSAWRPQTVYRPSDSIASACPLQNIKVKNLKSIVKPIAIHPLQEFVPLAYVVWGKVMFSVVSLFLVFRWKDLCEAKPNVVLFNILLKLVCFTWVRFGRGVKWTEGKADWAVADLRGGAPQIFSILCSFWGAVGKIASWHPPAGGLAHPPTVNPRSAPAEGKADYVLPSVCFTSPLWGGG